MNHPPKDEYSPQETERRRDDAIRRALNTPPKPHKEMIGKSERPKAAKDKSSKRH